MISECLVEESSVLHLNRNNGQALLVFLELGLHKIAWPQVTAFLFTKLKMFICSANVISLRGTLWNVVC